MAWEMVGVGWGLGPSLGARFAGSLSCELQQYDLETFALDFAKQCSEPFIGGTSVSIVSMKSRSKSLC